MEFVFIKNTLSEEQPKKKEGDNKNRFFFMINYQKDAFT